MATCRTYQQVLFGSLVACACVACYEYSGEGNRIHFDPRVIHEVQGWQVTQGVVAVNSDIYGPCFVAERESDRVRSRLELDSLFFYSIDSSMARDSALGRFDVARNPDAQFRWLFLCEQFSGDSTWMSIFCTHEYNGTWNAKIIPHDTLLMISYCRLRNRSAGRSDSLVVLTGLVEVPTLAESRESEIGRLREGWKNSGYMDDPSETRDSIQLPVYEIDP